MSRTLVSWIVFLGLAMILVTILQDRIKPTATIAISQFEQYVSQQQISKITIKQDGTIDGVLTEDAPLPPQASSRQFRVPYPPSAIDHDFLKSLETALPAAERRYEPTNQFLMVLLGMAPWILIFGVIWFFIIRQLRSAGGGGGMLGNFGRSRHRVTAKEHTHITFADVAGIDEAKDEVHEIIEFLRSPKKFQRLGGRTPRGVLLVGEPGCGKTLLAKAIAGEADVPFFSISGSDFVEMFVGVGRRACGTCSSRPRRIPPASSSWTRLTRWAASAERTSAPAGMTNASRR